LLYLNQKDHPHVCHIASTDYRDILLSAETPLGIINDIYTKEIISKEDTHTEKRALKKRRR
jgi:hypothetical protein